MTHQMAFRQTRQTLQNFPNCSERILI